MIDQRVLPARFEYIAYDSAAAVAEGIRSMVVRGAPAIGCAAAYGVALEALRLKEAAPAHFAPAWSRVSRCWRRAAPPRSTCSGRCSACAGYGRGWARPHRRKVAERLLDEAHEIHAEDIRINRAMGAHGAALLPDGARVLTHCNAGALATAGWGTALGVIRSAVEAGKKISVIADETRPFLQGARLTAWEMVQEGIPVTLITDNMAGHLMAHGEVDAVIVGTDRVAANGDVANKIGTYMVAVLARRHGIPFYVACPLSTIDLNIASGADIPIEERARGRSHRLPRLPMGGGGRDGPQSGLRRHAGRTGDRAHHRARRDRSTEPRTAHRLPALFLDVDAVEDVAAERRAA